jgi:hypothetical protein
MAKPPVKPAGVTASDADWQIASQREGALKMLLRSSSPAAVAGVAADLRLSSAMVYRLLAVYRRDPSTSSLLPNRGSRGLRLNVPNSYTGCRKRIALLDQVARLPQPRGQE